MCGFPFSSALCSQCLQRSLCERKEILNQLSLKPRPTVGISWLQLESPLQLLLVDTVK